MDALLAGQPRSPSVRGGLQDAPQGTEPALPRGLKDLIGDEQPEATEWTGKGELLEMSPQEAFRAIHDLVVRQEPLAKSRLAQDTHYTSIKVGYAFSSLDKNQDQDTYQQSFPPGMNLRIAAVPNKAADLVNKLTETLLVDAAKPDPSPETDDEAAEKGAEMAREFLEQDGGEAGTDDRSLFWSAVERATTCASAFLWVWVDDVGGGSIAKQIKAHPMATDPAKPLDALDPVTGQPVPTTDYVLRYVTAGDEASPAQFTDDPANAERVWVPRIRVEKLGREHVRTVPETKDVHSAEAVILLWFCTVGEAKRRWPETVGQMSDAELSTLCDWTPPRPLPLLPSALRARWRTASSDQRKTGNDERIVFFYAYLRHSDPDYPEGAVLCTSGASGGTELGKTTLIAEVEVPSTRAQDQTVRDRRDLDIPVVQVRLLQDPDGGDPMGKCVMARIAGANESSATIATGLLTQIDKILNPARFVSATSPLSDDDIEESRAGGRLAVLTKMEDAPKYEDAPDLPANTLDVVEWNHTQMDSSVGLNKPAQGFDDSNEVSGIARKIAVDQSLVSVSRMQHGVNIGWERYWRIKLQCAMRSFGVPQMLRYVGVDGAAKQEWFTGNNFAMVGGVAVKSGSGTLMPPSEKVNYALALRDAGLVDHDTAADVARPGYTQQLGVPENPHVQRIERQVSSWMEGAPEGWEEEAAQYGPAVQQHALMAQEALAMGGEIPPEPQAPWTPFAELPMDREPAIAALRKRRLATLMATVAFAAQPPAWQDVVKHAYEQTVGALMPQAPPMMQPGGAQPSAPTAVGSPSPTAPESPVAMVA